MDLSSTQFWIRGLTPMVIVAVLCGACATPAPPLANAQPTPERLAQAVVDAIATSDAARLQALAVDEQEFRATVWPSLPAARPERNLPVAFVWGDLYQKSERALAATIQSHGGRRYAVEGVRFDGPPTPYAGYVVHRDTTFDVRTPEGEPLALRLCGSLIEQDGAWKVFSYVVD